ncbi:MAG: glutamyl-tRNA reductase, partial [Aeromicrobium sp.]
AAGDVEGVTLIDLEVLSNRAENAELAQDIESVRAIVADEVRAFLAARDASNVTPTVVALRTMATAIVAAEISRLEARRPDLDEAVLADIRQSIKRVADKLIHSPTVRVQELTDGPAALTYAEALKDLFALDQAIVDAVTNVSGDQA